MGGGAISSCLASPLDLHEVGRTSLVGVSLTGSGDVLVATWDGKEAGALGPTEAPKVSVGRAPPQYGIVVELICLTRLPLLPFGRFGAGPELEAPA